MDVGTGDSLGTDGTGSRLGINGAVGMLMIGGTTGRLWIGGTTGRLWIGGTTGKLWIGGTGGTGGRLISGEYVDGLYGIVRFGIGMTIESLPGPPHFEATVCRVLFHQAQENGVVLFLSDGITNGVGQEEENDEQEYIVQFLNNVSVMFASSGSTSSGLMLLTWEIQTPKLFAKGTNSLVAHALEDSAMGFEPPLRGPMGGSLARVPRLEPPVAPAQIRSIGQRG